MSEPIRKPDASDHSTDRTDVTIVIAAHTIGGHEMQLVQLLNSWKATRNMKLVVLSNAAYAYFRDRFESVIQLDYHKTGKIWSQWLSAPALANVLRPHLSSDDEVVVSGGTIEACVAPARAVRMLRPKAMITAYLPMYIDRRLQYRSVGGIYNMLSKLFISSIDRFITINRVQALLIKAHYGKPVSIVRNRITPFERPEQDFGPRLIYVGRLDDQQKAVSDLITLLDDAANPFREFHIFGDGPDRASAEQAVRNCSHIAVTMHGWMGHDDIQQCLGARDVLVMNSRWEGEPMIVRELQAAGIDAIVTEIPGFRGILPRSRRYSSQPQLLDILNRDFRRLTLRGSDNG